VCGYRFGVAAVAAVAFYEHAYALVRAHGEAGRTARLVPLTVDELIHASSMVMPGLGAPQNAGPCSGAVAAQHPLPLAECGGHLRWSTGDDRWRPPGRGRSGRCLAGPPPTGKRTSDRQARSGRLKRPHHGRHVDRRNRSRTGRWEVALDSVSSCEAAYALVSTVGRAGQARLVPLTVVARRAYRRTWSPSLADGGQAQDIEYRCQCSDTPCA
jgi:hypothetical protein